MRKWWPLVTICLGTFMLLVDVTIVNVALPDMAIDLQTTFTSLQWVIDAYALTLAALLLGIGSLADRFGHRRSYVIGLVLFAVASLACGLAPNANILIAARAVQGIGAAAMLATTFALINSSYQGRDRGTAYGIWGAIAGAAAAFGPIVGGILTQAISWRWIFFVNLPISIVAIALCFVVLAADAGVRGPRLDLAGTVSFTAFTGTLVYALILTGSDGWSAPIVWVLLTISVLSLLAFLAVERSSSHAMLDLSLFTSRSFVGIMVAALLINFAAFAALTYTSLWLQSVIGLSPLQAGLTGLPLSLASFAMSAMIGRFLHRSRPGPIIGTGMMLIGLGSGLVALLLRDSSSWPALIPGYIIIGIGVGLALPTLSSTAMSAVPIHRGGMAAGVVNTARQLGFALGIAVLGSVFAAGARQSLNGSNAPNSSTLANSLVAGQAHAVLAATPPEQQPLVEHLLRAAATHGLGLAFGLAAIIGLIAGALVLGLVRPKTEAVAAAEPAGVAA